MVVLLVGCFCVVLWMCCCWLLLVVGCCWGRCVLLLGRVRRCVSLALLMCGMVVHVWPCLVWCVGGCRCWCVGVVGVVVGVAGCVCVRVCVLCV